jgi:phage FluMu gp28-like protein
MTEAPNAITKVEEDSPRATSADELIAQSDLTADDVAAAEEVAKQTAKGKPIVALTEYQKLIVACARRFIAFMISRQGGKTFGSTLRIARILLKTPLNYYVLSRSERQSGNAMAQLAAHLRAAEKALRAKGKRIGAAPAYQSQKLLYRHADGSALQYTRLSIALPNGAKAIGLPASPDTIVGISGSVYCDEFALHKDSRDIYGRLFPVVSRRREYEMLITSTPRGTGNKFYEIMTSDDYAEIFERLIVDIFTAVKQGLVLYDYNGDAITDDAGIERLRTALKDDDKWAEEYLCQFINDVLNLLTHEMISACESLHDPDGKPYEILDRAIDKTFDPRIEDLTKSLHCGDGDLYLGHDIARNRDLSVIWLDEDVGGTLWQRALIRMKNVNYDAQEAILWQFLDLPKLRKAGIDATGMGGRTAERAATKYGSKIVPVNFSGRIQDKHGNAFAVKSLLARVIRERHQDGRDRYPVLDAIRSDFIRVKRKPGASPDTFTYFADHDETGHADIFTAKGLSDLVFQELLEFAGRVDGVRLLNEFGGGPRDLSPYAGEGGAARPKAPPMRFDPGEDMVSRGERGTY